jgi:hypothetical protein
MSLLYLGDSYALHDPVHSNWATQWGMLGNFPVALDGGRGRSFVDMAVRASQTDFSKYSGVVLHYTNIMRLRGSASQRSDLQIADDLLAAQCVTVPEYLQNYPAEGRNIQTWMMHTNQFGSRQARRVYTDLDTAWLVSANWFAVQYICYRVQAAGVPLIVTYADPGTVLDAAQLPGCRAVIHIPAVNSEWQALAEHSENHLCLAHAQWFAQQIHQRNQQENLLPTATEQHGFP